MLDQPERHNTGPRIVCTRAGMVLGARSMLPIVPSMAFFAIAVGTLAAQRGLSFGEFALMQGFVFAGVSQLVALGGWQDTWTLAALLGILAVSFTINSRMILMGASLRPWMKDQPFWRNALSLFALTDANWLTAIRYHEEGGTDVGHLIGSGLFLWVFWLAIGLVGYGAGSLIANPRAFGLDLFMPVFFVVMVAPLWKGRRHTLAWGIAGVVATILHAVLPGYFYIVGGALAGMTIGAFYDGK
ncbi:MAG: AzlC family ABC transporter permease [Beijerinckiaceae bacterium]|nr:AzlC family ABC transporter permease [Beijerinckiaceae bacterium]